MLLDPESKSTMIELTSNKESEGEQPNQRVDGINHLFNCGGFIQWSPLLTVPLHSQGIFNDDFEYGETSSHNHVDRDVRLDGAFIQSNSAYRCKTISKWPR